MKIIIYCQGKSHNKYFLNLAAAGFKRHGYKAEIHEPSNIVDCDLAVFWAHRNIKAMNRQKSNGKDYLVMERGYIGDRFKWASLGFNGLNGRADFLADKMPSDRWDNHFKHYMQRWRNDNGNYVLIAGQVAGDASIKGVDIQKWCQKVCDQVKSISSKTRVVFRQHPVEAQRGVKREIVGAEKSTKSLAEDLDGARCCITYNSNTGVDAVLAGIPVVAIDEGSMVYNLAAHELDLNPPKPDRTQWAYNMAYCQWTEQEIADGTAWEHLKQRYE